MTAASDTAAGVHSFSNSVCMLLEDLKTAVVNLLQSSVTRSWRRGWSPASTACQPNQFHLSTTPLFLAIFVASHLIARRAFTHAIQLMNIAIQGTRAVSSVNSAWRLCLTGRMSARERQDFIKPSEY